METLTREAGETCSFLVGDVEKWIRLVVRTRNDVMVHRGLDEGDEPDFYLLSESLYFLVVLCLLRECGVSDDTLSGVQENHRVRWLSNQMQSLYVGS